MSSQRMISRLGAWWLFAAASAACTESLPESAGLGDTPRYDAGYSAPDAARDAARNDAGAEAGRTDDDADASADAGPGEDYPPPLCAGLAVGAGELLPFSTPADDHGLAVTPDELSAAWVTSSGGVVTVHYVDRADASSAFGAERTTTGAFADDRVALTPDGLGLAVVNEGRLGFSLLSRTSTVEAFGGPTVGPFGNLNQQGVDTYGPAGLTYADPVFARNGSYLLFSRVGGPSTEATVLVASHFQWADPLSFGSPFAAEALMPVGAQRKIVTAMSSDLRTLFVWDESAQKTRVVTLAPSFEPSETTDLGEMRDLQASADCKTVYYTSNGQLYRYAAP